MNTNNVKGHEYDDDGVCVHCRFDSAEHYWLNRGIPAEYAEPVPACTNAAFHIQGG